MLVKVILMTQRETHLFHLNLTQVGDNEETCLWEVLAHPEGRERNWNEETQSWDEING